MHQYIPMPQRSGYDTAEQEFKAFARLTRKDLRTIQNSIYNITSQMIKQPVSNPVLPAFNVAMVSIQGSNTATTTTIAAAVEVESTAFACNDHQVAYNLLEIRKQVVNILDNAFPE